MVNSQHHLSRLLNNVTGLLLDYWNKIIFHICHCSSRYIAYFDRYISCLLFFNCAINDRISNYDRCSTLIESLMFQFKNRFAPISINMLLELIKVFFLLTFNILQLPGQRYFQCLAIRFYSVIGKIDINAFLPSFTLISFHVSNIIRISFTSKNRYSFNTLYYFYGRYVELV